MSNESNWISVKERLPNKNGQYITKSLCGKPTPLGVG